MSKPPLMSVSIGLIKRGAQGTSNLWQMDRIGWAGNANPTPNSIERIHHAWHMQHQILFIVAWQDHHFFRHVADRPNFFRGCRRTPFIFSCCRQTAHQTSFLSPKHPQNFFVVAKPPTKFPSFLGVCELNSELIITLLQLQNRSYLQLQVITASVFRINKKQHN